MQCSAERPLQFQVPTCGKTAQQQQLQVSSWTCPMARAKMQVIFNLFLLRLHVALSLSLSLFLPVSLSRSGCICVWKMGKKGNATSKPKSKSHSLLKWSSTLMTACENENGNATKVVGGGVGVGVALCWARLGTIFLFTPGLCLPRTPCTIVAQAADTTWSGAQRTCNACNMWTCEKSKFQFQVPLRSSLRTGSEMIYA